MTDFNKILDKAKEIEEKIKLDRTEWNETNETKWK